MRTAVEGTRLRDDAGAGRTGAGSTGRAMDRQGDEDVTRVAERRRMLLDILNVRLGEAHRQMMTDYSAAAPRKPAPPAGPGAGPLRGGARKG
ncbi:hypothetical protein GE300_01305 [Rhodobacteraceae bacterium 2CG4]|uniref:Uncharacterized protein n=1 Tax=Halovulum marinum TaxID=2662447 RepID=A0A6L5YVD3_9RHOB|nr:hypothetical protein [Halovulum marinum]MSU88251.1 hypothetical protein [Halovulum marinum]